jgi:hypothetical protein
MPFSNKQSDIFYNDETKEMFVCTVSAITAARCETGDTIYGALPIIYKIDKDTNYKKTVYPSNLATFSTDENSDLYNLTPECPVDDLNFDSITKPLINFNKDTSRYSVTFLGRFSSDVDGLVINNYIFENVDNKFHLLKAKSLLPPDSLSASNGRFTFDSGYLNSDLYTGGNTVRNQNSSWFNPSDGPEVERSPNYMIGPTYVESTSALGFNLIQDNTTTTLDALTGNKNFPFMYGGGYITVNPKYVAFDPQHTIRIDFRARSFNVPSPTAYASTQSVGTSATRWIQQYAPNGSGEGFCVYLFKQPDNKSYVVPNGVATTLGYSPADFNVVESAGSAQTTVGLFERDNWDPYQGRDRGFSFEDGGSGNIGEHTGANIGDGEPANSFLGVGFDIGGNFATTTEDKPGWYDAVEGSSHTASPCSVAVRGNRFTDCQVLTAVDLSGVPGATSIPLHTSASNAVFVDYRIDLSNKGRRLTVYHKLTSSTDYNTILDLRLNKVQGSVGSGSEYDPWSGFNVDPIEENYPLLNVGLSFTTSTKTSQFELHSFEVKGVKVHNPWVQKEKPADQETKDRIDYINQSSENLRKRLVNQGLVPSLSSNENVNVEMVVPAKKGIANDIYEETNTTEITLCSDNDPDKIEEEVEVKYTGIRPETIDRVIQATERGELIPEIGGNPISRTTQDIDSVTYEDIVRPIEPLPSILPETRSGYQGVCWTKTTSDTVGYAPAFQLHKTRSSAGGNSDLTYTHLDGTEVSYIVYIRTRQYNQTSDTFVYYERDIKKINDRFVDAIAHDFEYNGIGRYTKVWELALLPDDDRKGDESDYDISPSLSNDWQFLARGSIEDANEFYAEGNGVCIITESGTTFPPSPTGPHQNTFKRQMNEYLSKYNVINVPNEIVDEDGGSLSNAYVMTYEQMVTFGNLWKTSGQITGNFTADEYENPFARYPGDPFYVYYEFRGENPGHIAVQVTNGSSTNIRNIKID